MQLPDGTWCDDESSLRDAATIYFRNLYADSDATGGCYPISRCFPYDDNHLMEYLYTVPLFDELSIMALSSKLGSLLRQNGQTPMITLMLNSLRCMSTSSKKFFIGGLSYGTDDQTLKGAFF
ncbi:hypothetical protein V6N11_071528 [Hibiscus sabdariffa]|uniref:Uncharacterized protein n=1 Tax=Hibiscus sabdariffa TaxID=183260 RepID=A0ABR2U0C7_9ROSI